MQALVGQALIEIRATWEGVAADTRAALAEVEGQIAATEARIGANVGGTVSDVEASSKAMAAAVKTATDEVGIAWVSASEAGTQFAVSQSEVRAGIRGATIDAQSLAASTDGLIAGFLGASQAGQVFTTTEAGMRAEMRAVAADADEAFATMFTGFATGSQQLESQIAAAIAAEKALGAGAVEAASEIQILDGTAAALRATLRGTIIDEARLSEASADVAAGTRTAAEGVALMRAEAARLAASAKVSAIDTKNLGDESEGTAAKMLTEAQAAQVVAATATELKAQLSALAVVTSAELSRLGEAIAFAAGQLTPFSLGLANLGAGVTFGTTAIVEFRDAMALATIQTGQFVLSTEATSAASTAFTAEIQRQIAAQEQLNFATASRLAMNAAVAQSDAEVAAATAAATREQSALSVALGASTGSVEINTAAQRRNTEVVGSAVTADRARFAGLSRLAAAVAASTVQTDAEAVALLKALGAKEADIAATMAELVAAGEWTAALNTQNAAIASNTAAKKSATATTKGFGDEVENAAVKFNFLTRTIRNSLFIVTGLEAATAAVTIKMAEEENKLLNLSQQFGIASAEISGFSLLSKATGESIDTINTSLRMMQKGFAGVGDGSNLAQQAFAALGIQTAKTGATARDTSTIFKQVADVMALIPDGEQKIAVGTAIMGRSFNAVIPLINQGSAGFDRMTQASRELGTELTTLELLTGRSIVTAWTDFKGAIQGVGFAIEKELAPSILKAITTTTQWIAANRELVASNIAGFVRTVGSAFGDAVVFVSQNIGAMKEFAMVAAGATVAYKLLTSETLVNAAATLTNLGRMEAFKLTVSTVSGAISTAISGAIQPLTTLLGGPLVIALAAASAGILDVVHHEVELANGMDRAAESVRRFQTELNRLTPKQRDEQSTVRALQAEYNNLAGQIENANAELEKARNASKEGKDPYVQAEEIRKQEQALSDLQVEMRAVGTALDREKEKTQAASAETSVLTQKAIESSRARDLLFSAVKNLSAGLGLEADQVKAVETATGELLPALKAEFSQKKLSTQATEGLSRALGIEGDVIQRTVAQTGNLELGNDKAGKAAARAAAQVDKFNASAAKATAQEMATQVTALANELSRLSLPEAIERLPALLNLNAQALDAEVAAIRAETETKLSAAKTEEARNAALAEEADRIQKATTANELHAQKLVDTVTHTESAAKITAEYTKTIRSLQEAQDALKITVIDDQIKAITDSWKNLDIATRESQLPQVLDLIAQKYDILAAKETAESEAKIANARATYDSAEAAYALTGSQEDLASMVAALNALWDITDAVQANAALSAEDLAFKMNAEAQAARDAAAGTTDLAQAQQLAAGMASDLSKALVDVVSGTKDAAQNLGKQIIAQIFDKSLVSFATSAIQSIIQPALNGVLGGISFQQLGSQFGAAIASPFIAAFGSTAGEQFGPTLAELGTTQAAVDASMKVGATTGASIVQGLSSFLQNVTIVAAPIALAAGIGTSIAQAFNSDTEIGKLQGAVDSYLYASIVGIPVAMLDQITGGLVSKLLGSLFGLGPNMEERIAAWFSRSIGKSFKDPQVAAAVDAGAKSIGDAVGASLLRAMTNVPVKAIHDGLHDQVSSIFSGESAAVQTEIQQLAQAVGTSVSAEMGYVGSQAIAFSQQWANAWLRAQVDSGKSAQQIIKELRAMAEAFGTSGGLFAALDELNRKLLETGRSEEVFADLGAIIKDWTGAKKSEISTLSDVLAAFGGDTVLTLNAIKKAFEDAGIPIEQFTGDLGDVVLAFSGDAGTVIRDASKDMQDFGNYSDGTAQIIEQKVVAALGNVVKTAEQLGYTPESIEALGTAASLISPELLKSDAVIQALHDSFAEMAVGAHMSIRELVDSIDPPLPAAVREAILSVDDLAAALGSLSDAPLSSLKEVTDRMKQFAGDMYREVEDETGKMTTKLTAFGEQLVKDAVSAIGGMWDTITADGVIDPSDIQAVFEQLAQIPEEVLGDSSVQSSIQSLLAMIGEQTGDAFIIGLSALPEVTKAQLDEALKIYDEWKKDVEDQPVQPEVQPTVEPATNPDGTPADTGASPTGPDTSAATAAPPPAPVPPETVKSWQDITAAAKEYALAVIEGRVATTALSAEVVTRAAEMLAAIQPLYGVEDDKQSVSALDWILRQVAEVTLPEVVVPGFAEFATQASIAVSTVFGKVGELQSALSGLVTNGPYEVSVVTHYTSDGTPPQATQQPPPMAVGGWIPGAIGSPYPITAHGQELVVPAATATTLPPSLVDALLSGTAFRMPADFAPRLSPVAVGNTDPAQSATAPDPDFVAVRMSKADAAAAMYAPLMVMVERDSRNGMVRFKDGKAKIHPHLRARARRG